MSLGAAQAREKEQEKRKRHKAQEREKEKKQYNRLFTECVARQKRLFTKVLFEDAKLNDTEWVKEHATGNLRLGWARDKKIRMMPVSTNHQLESHQTEFSFPQLNLTGGVTNDENTLKDGIMLSKASSKIKLTKATIVGPLRNHQVAGVSSSMLHTLVVTRAGKILSFGEGRSGQLGNSLTKSVKTPTLICWFKEVQVLRVAAGGSHSLVLGRSFKSCNIDLYAFGENTQGQLGLGSIKSFSQYSTPQLVKSQWVDHKGIEGKVTAIRAGAQHSLVQLDSGALFTWGSNVAGQLGHGEKYCLVDEPKQVLALKHENVQCSACGDLHTAVVTDAGDIWAWGRGIEGQLGHGKEVKKEIVPCPITLPDFANLKFSLVACGRYHTVVTTEEGRVYSFGGNKGGQLSIGDSYTKGCLVPKPVEWDLEGGGGAPLYRIDAIAVGAHHTVVKDANGSVYSVGWSGFNGRLGHTTSKKIDRFKQVTVYRQDALNEDLCWQRGFLERVVDKNLVNHTVMADYLFPIDAIFVENGNLVSDEIIEKVEKNIQRIYTGNFLCRLQRVFRSLDLAGDGILGEMTVYRILLRLHVSTWNLGINSHGFLRKGADGIGSCEEWDFINFLIEKFEGNFVKKAYFSPPYRFYKWLRDESDEVNDEEPVQSMHVKTFIRIFLNHCEHLGVHLSKERIQLMFEFEVNPKDERARLKQQNRNLESRYGIESVAPQNPTAYSHIDPDDSLRPPSRELHRLLEQEGRPWSAQVKQRLAGAYDETPESRPTTPLGIVSKKVDIAGNRMEKVKFRPPNQPLLKKGIVDWSNQGITDNHMKALALSLKEMPIFKEINLEGNVISDVGINELIDVIEWQYVLSEYDMDTTRCMKCNNDVYFASRSRHTAFCVLCNVTCWRPVYLLAKFHCKDVLSPRQRFKWTQSKFDEDSSQQIANLLNTRDPPISLSEFKTFYDRIIDEHVARFSSHAEAYFDSLNSPSKFFCLRHRRHRQWVKQAQEDVAMMVRELRDFSEHCYHVKHLPRYHIIALSELQKRSNDIRKWLVQEAFQFFHAHVVPLSDKALLERVQQLHAQAAMKVKDTKWEFRKMTRVTEDVLYAISKCLYAHYVQLNKQITVSHISCGHSDTLTISMSGAVYSFGNNSGITEAFKEQIVYNLPDRYRASIENDRTKAKQSDSQEAQNLFGAPIWVSLKEAESVSSKSFDSWSSGSCTSEPSALSESGSDNMSISSLQDGSPYRLHRANLRSTQAFLPTPRKHSLSIDATITSMRKDYYLWQQEIKDSIAASIGENSIVAVTKRLEKRKMEEESFEARKNAAVHVEIGKMRERDAKRQMMKKEMAKRLEREAMREEEIRVRMAGESYEAQVDHDDSEAVRKAAEKAATDPRNDKYYVDPDESKYGRKEDLVKLFPMLDVAMILGIWEALGHDYKRVKVALLHLLEAKVEADAEVKIKSKRL